MGSSVRLALALPHSQASPARHREELERGLLQQHTVRITAATMHARSESLDQILLSCQDEKLAQHCL